jgi:deoxyadenosine/deoxycytidine kinase
MPAKRPLIVSIEGNIGAGKSTILEALRYKNDNLNVVFMQEPVSVWETVVDESGKTILMKYYENPDKYAFPFQIMAYTTRLSALKNCIENNPDCDVIVCERSLEADKNIFAKMLHDDGTIERMNYQIYNMLYNDTSKNYAVDAIVYLRADPVKCLNRIHKRSRNGESSISVEYLSSCHRYYDTWLMGNTDIPIMHLDVNSDVEYDVPGMGSNWVTQIEEFINDCIDDSYDRGAQIMYSDSSAM